MNLGKANSTVASLKRNQPAVNRFHFLLVIYKGLWIVTMFLKAVPYLDWHISPYIRLLLIPGILLILWDLIRGGRLWSRSMWFLAAFCGSYVITAVLNGGAGFSANIKAAVYMALTFYLFYGHDRNREFAQVKKEVRWLGNLYVAGSFLLSLACFYTFLFSINQMYVSGDHVGYLGMWDERLWGLYNANTGGAINVISLLATAYLWKAAESATKLTKMWYGVNGVLQFICLALTYSRTSIYSLILAVGFGIFFFGVGKWESKCTRTLPGRLFFRAGVFLIAAVLMGAAFPVVRQGLLHLPHPVSEERQATGYFSTPEQMAEHRGGVLTGRPILWEAGAKAFFDSPVFGVGRENLYEKTVPYLSDPSWSPDLKAGGVHNGYLTIFISSGLMGAVFLIAFLLWNGKRIVKQLISRNHNTDSVFVFGMVFLVMMLIMELFEARILYQVNLFMCLLWMGAGYVMDYAERKEIN